MAHGLYHDENLAFRASFTLDIKIRILVNSTIKKFVKLSVDVDKGQIMYLSFKSVFKSTFDFESINNHSQIEHLQLF